MSDHDTWNMFAAAALGGIFRAYELGSIREPDGKPIPEITPTGFAAVTAEFADALLAESKKRETPAEPDALAKVHEAIDGYVDALVARKNGIAALDRAFDLICYGLGRSPSAEMDAKRRIVSEAGVTKGSQS